MTPEDPHSETEESYEKLALPKHSSGIAIQCQFCPCQSFRRSRLRSKDFTDLFLMRYPVRCLRCGQRQTVSYTVAAISIPSHIRHKSVSMRSSRSRKPKADSVPPGDAVSGSRGDADSGPRGDAGAS